MITNSALTSLDLVGDERMNGERNETRKNKVNYKKRTGTGNQIWAEGVRVMSEALKVNSTLTSLDLARDESECGRIEENE